MSRTCREMRLRSAPTVFSDIWSAAARVDERKRNMDDKRDIVAAWVAREILPHESAIHAWVSRRWRHAVDPDDVIQEAYCRISSLASVDHIHNPVGYFRRTVHAAAIDTLRRAGI